MDGGPVLNAANRIRRHWVMLRKTQAPVTVTSCYRSECNVM